MAFSAFVCFSVMTFTALVENFNESASTVDHTVVDSRSLDGFLMTVQFAVVEKV